MGYRLIFSRVVEFQYNNDIQVFVILFYAYYSCIIESKSLNESDEDKFIIVLWTHQMYEVFLSPVM